ncbi:hypothetical protein [Streptomyces sp. NPDC057682]|uniref:hypothetical protein n=1 Tax=Streptomyces sp. NPDC057682 TaxID=3346210 RepID=UPI00368944CB
MTVRAGEDFALGRAVADVEALAAAPLPAGGPVTAEGDPATGEWAATTGDGFRVVPLWESGSFVGVDGAAWDEAQEAGDTRLAALTGELDRRWGGHHEVPVHGALLLHQAGEPVPELFAALLDEDCTGDLLVWGPVTAGRRWIAVGVGHSDGDAPLIMAAAVSDRPIIAPDPPAWL